MAAALDELAAQVDAGADLVLARPHRLPVLDDRRLRGRAAHVERDQLRPPRQPAQVAAGHHAGRRARTRRGGPACAAPISGVSVPPLDCITSSGAAMPASPELLDERGDVARDRRADVRVDDGGARPLVLADLRQDLRRARDVDARRRRAARTISSTRRSCASSAYEWSSAIATASTSVVRGSARATVFDRALVELAPDLASRPEPLADLVPEPARNERLRALVLDVVEDGDPETSHLEDVAEALRRDQRRPRAATLEDRVRGDGRGVHDAGDLGPVDAALGEQRHRSGHDAAGVVVGRGQHLLRPHGAVVAEQDDVRERAADVDAEAEAAGGGGGQRRSTY